MRVLHVLSELYPLIKTGGLADVGGALIQALRKKRIDARPVIPGYPAVLSAMEQPRNVWSDRDFFRGGPAQLWSTTLAPLGVPAYVLESPGLFGGRAGNPYCDDQGRDYPDNHRRFAALASAAAALASGVDPDFEPDVVHGHDWQAGLVPAYLKLLHERPVPTLHTIHNINYTGSFDASLWHELGLPDYALSLHGAEFYGGVSFLKAGLYYADRLSTVSPTYAREIQEAEHGAGFEGLLRARSSALVGILNGVDETEWSPARDPHLALPYDGRRLNLKLGNRRALLGELGLPEEGGLPTFGVVSRLAWQKGLDLLPPAVEPLLAAGQLRLLILGSGDRELEDQMRALAKRYPRLVGVRIGYDEGLAHRIQAGCDGLLVPSRTEPCGLTQLYALRYGTVPVVRRTGGLSDTVQNATPASLRARTATGFVFEDPSPEALRDALQRACGVYAHASEWRELQRAGMRQDFSWRRSAQSYVDLYLELSPSARTSSLPPRRSSAPPAIR